MKRITSRLAAALAAFCLGVVAAQSPLNFSAPPAAGLMPAQALPPSPSGGPPPDAVRITLDSLYRNEGGSLTAEFNVENGGEEALRYVSGGGGGRNAAWNVRRGARSHRYTPSCGNGLEERVLPPGGRAEFQALLEVGTGEFQVGFDFLSDDGHPWQTIWSGDLNKP